MTLINKGKAGNNLKNKEAKRNKMKKYTVILIVLLLLVITSCSSVSDLIPKALAAETQDTIQQVEADSNDVFSEIQSNIDMVAALKAKVQQSQIDGKPLSLDGAIKDLQSVTTSYEKLSRQHDAIRQGLLKKIANIDDMQSQVNNQVTSLKQKRADYARQLSMVNDPNPDIVKSRQVALTQAIKYVDAQISLWASFSGIQGDIIDEMVNVQKSIDSFLNVIDSSSILFREGLNLLVLQRDINDALSLFTQDLPKITQLTTDMQKSWDNLNFLVENLTSVSVSIK